MQCARNGYEETAIRHTMANRCLHLGIKAFRRRGLEEHSGLIAMTCFRVRRIGISNQADKAERSAYNFIYGADIT